LLRLNAYFLVAIGSLITTPKMPTALSIYRVEAAFKWVVASAKVKRFIARAVSWFLCFWCHWIASVCTPGDAANSTKQNRQQHRRLALINEHAGSFACAKKDGGLAKTKILGQLKMLRVYCNLQNGSRENQLV
jgi:hypothetical protein